MRATAGEAVRVGDGMKRVARRITWYFWGLMARVYHHSLFGSDPHF